MRLLGLVVSAVCLGPALADGLDDLVKEFPQPKHRNLRAAGEVHASKKVYPQAPDASLPKSFDVWRPYFRELYEKVRCPPPLPRAPHSSPPFFLSPWARSNATA